MKLLCWTFVFAAACCACSRGADIVAFETAPDGTTPVDDALLSSSYSMTGGTIRFFYDKNGNNVYDASVDAFPAFEAAGRDAINAFATNWNDSSDTARAAYTAQLGNYFLRTAGSGNPSTLPPPPPGPFIAQCITSGTISGFSGELWYIDGGSNGGTEQWTIEVLDGSGNVLSSQLSPLGVDDSSSSLDGLPWTFTFSGMPASAKSLRLNFIGSKMNGIGFAFNNFSVSVVPEPCCSMLLAIFFACAACCRQRSR